MNSTTFKAETNRFGFFVAQNCDFFHNRKIFGLYYKLVYIYPKFGAMENQTQAQQQLAFIESMIQSARNRLADDGFYLIFWGWLVFAAALINYLCLVFGIQRGFYVWAILMPFGAIFSILYGKWKNKSEKVKTLVDSYFHFVWIAFGIGLTLALFFMGQNGLRSTYFFLMLLYGIATFTSGGLLSFKPLIYGSIVSFVMAAVAMLVPQKELLLCISVAILFSYIIPGHLLKKQYQKENNV